MTTLPSELQEFAALLDAQPSPVQIAFQYAMCLLMVEKGRMRLAESQPAQKRLRRLRSNSCGLSWRMKAGKRRRRQKLKYLPCEFKRYDLFLDNLPPYPDRVIFLYCLCLILCEAGKLHQRNIVEGEDWAMAFFETLKGERFFVLKLPLDPTKEAEFMAGLRPIMETYGL